MRPGARRRRWVACCAVCRRRQVGGDTIWVNMARAYADLPEHVKTQIAGLRARHSIEASFGAAMPDRKAPRAEGALSRCGASRRAYASGDGREGPVRQRLRDALRELSYAAERALRPGLRARRGAAPELSDRPRRDSRVPGALALDRRTASRSGTTAARSTTPCRTTGLRCARWSAPESSATNLTDSPHPSDIHPRGTSPCSF